MRKKNKTAVTSKTLKRCLVVKIVFRQCVGNFTKLNNGIMQAIITGTVGIRKPATEHNQTYVVTPEAYPEILWRDWIILL